MVTQGTILLIDDSRTMRALLRKALEDANYTIFEAETGEKGLEIFTEIKPDAILLDVEMPGIDGFETCARLRKLPGGEHVPIIMSTSLDDLVSINKAYDAKATDFITKPINWDLIAHRVRYAIRTHLDYLALQDSKSELLKAQKELQMFNEQLEQRVNEKTAELQIANQSLKDTQDQLINSFRQVSIDKATENLQEILLKKELEEIFVNLKPILRQTLLNVTVDCPDQLFITSYPVTLARVMTILVVNTVTHAFKPEQTGEIICKVSLDDNYIILSYADSGVGISEQDLKRIFEPFFTSKNGVKYVGLGLHTAYNLVRHVLGGEIKCASTLGKGTTFTIRLPLRSS